MCLQRVASKLSGVYHEKKKKGPMLIWGSWGNKEIGPEWLKNWKQRGISDTNAY